MPEPIFRDRNPITDIFVTREPKIDIIDVRLTGQTRMKITKLIKEQESGHMLRAKGFRPRYRCLFYGAAGTGKAQPLYSKIAIPNGEISMGEVKIGDIVISPEGGTATIVGIFPQGEKEIVEITVGNEATVQCCDEHLWKVFHNGRWQIIETKDLIYAHAQEETLLLPVVDPTNPTQPTRSPITNIRYTGEKTKMQCIAVDHPENLYITDHGIVTHNTIVAEAIAHDLNRKLHIFNLEMLSGTNPDAALKTVMDALRIMNQSDDVFLFDEFDAVAANRGAGNAGGAARQTSNALLIAFEQITSKAILICATNFLSTIDPAFRRRFDTICKFVLPDVTEREAILKMALKKYNASAPEGDILEAAKRTEGLSYHEAEEVAVCAIKTSIIENTKTVNLIAEVPAAIERRMAFKQLHDE